MRFKRMGCNLMAPAIALAMPLLVGACLILIVANGPTNNDQKNIKYNMLAGTVTSLIICHVTMAYAMLPIGTFMAYTCHGKPGYVLWVLIAVIGTLLYLVNTDVPKRPDLQAII